MVFLLARVIGVGVETADMLVQEVHQVLTGLLKLMAGQNGGDAQLTGRSPESVAVGQAIEVFPLGAPFEDFRSS
jgi:hypothetical protein